MIKKIFPVFITLLALSVYSWSSIDDKWITEQQNGYSVHYTSSDLPNIKEYKRYFEMGKTSTEEFFQSSFKDYFKIYVHPSRSSLDSTWQKDWNMPGFNSQCWMVASGISDKLDIISPKMWDGLACEHSYSDSIKTQRLIAHELVHVYHGQQNKSPDFSNVTGIDWFVEGLAVYASGQCDAERISEVKNAISENNIPDNLNNMWSGQLKYGLSGTLVMYIDKKYGRATLLNLLIFNDLEDLLYTLNSNESELINEWKEYMKKLKTNH